jgi:hypothetical protein
MSFVQYSFFRDRPVLLPQGRNLCTLSGRGPFAPFSDPNSLQSSQFVELTNQASIFLLIEIVSHVLQQPAFAVQA